MKKILFILCTAMLLGLGSAAYAAEEYLMMKDNSYLAMEDGTVPSVVDTMAVIVPHREGDVLMVPLRYTFEHLGASVGWDAVANAIDIAVGDTHSKVVTGSNQAVIREASVTMPAPIIETFERSYMDIDTVSQILQMPYEVDEEGFIYIGLIPEDKTQAKENYAAVWKKLEGNTAEFLFEDNFTEESKENWVVETDGDETETIVTFGNGVMDTFTTKGLTIWNKHKFEGNYRVEFDADFVLGNYDFERLSDLNFFWNASDPDNPDDVFAESATRGDFVTYNKLHLYYVGYGGNYNESTRMRKYLPTERKIVGQYLEPPFLLEEGKTLHIAVEYIDGYSKVYRNGELMFMYYDPEPYTEGNFGVRTTINHVLFSNFKAYRLVSAE